MASFFAPARVRSSNPQLSILCGTEKLSFVDPTLNVSPIPCRPLAARVGAALLLESVYMLTVCCVLLRSVQCYVRYELAIAMHMSFGVAACYRGPGLYDTPAVATMVNSWVSWFKEHRRVLTADIIHIRRPDGQGVDGIVSIPQGVCTRGWLILGVYSARSTHHSGKANLRVLR